MQGSIFVPLFQLKVPAQLGGPPICPGPICRLLLRSSDLNSLQYAQQSPDLNQIFAIRACERSGAGSGHISFRAVSTFMKIPLNISALIFAVLYLSSKADCALN